MTEAEMRDGRVRVLMQMAREVTERAWDAARPEGEPDAANWGTGKANDVVASMLFQAEQLYLLCLALKQNFPTTFEMSPTSMNFLRGLGVPITDIAEKADLSRPTVYGMLGGLLEDFQKENPDKDVFVIGKT